MIDLHGQAGLPFVKKSVYTGSYQGMRYRLRKKEEEEETCLEAVIYPEPYSFEKTDDAQKTAHDFPLTPEGFDEAIAWLNAEYEAQQERWKKAATAPWV